MNGDDDHERILTLEGKMDEVRDTIADMRGSNKVWAIVMATIVSVVFMAAQSYFTKPTTNDEVKAAVQDLTKELKRIQRDYQAGDK